MARSCVTDPRWRELVALYRYDWIAAADVLFGKTPTWQQDLIIESVQEQGSKTSVSSGHGTGKSDMTSIMIMLFIIMYPGARAIIVANKIQQVMTGIFKYIKINWATATSRFPWLADYFVLTETAFYEVTGKGVWTVVPKGFRLGSEEALAGEHADHLLYIIDEASGVSDRAFGIITGALTGQDNRILLLSQPTRPSGYFYDTHHKLAKRPGNPDGVYTAITLNSEESPLVTPAFIKMKLAENKISISGYEIEDPDYKGYGLILMKGNEELCRYVNELTASLLDNGWLLETYKTDEKEAIKYGFLQPSDARFKDENDGEE